MMAWWFKFWNLFNEILARLKCLRTFPIAIQKQQRFIVLRIIGGKWQTFRNSASHVYINTLDFVSDDDSKRRRWLHTQVLPTSALFFCACRCNFGKENYWSTFVVGNEEEGCHMKEEKAPIGFPLEQKPCLDHFSLGVEDWRILWVVSSGV